MRITRRHEGWKSKDGPKAITVGCTSEADPNITADVVGIRCAPPNLQIGLLNVKGRQDVGALQNRLRFYCSAFSADALLKKQCWDPLRPNNLQIGLLNVKSRQDAGALQNRLRFYCSAFSADALLKKQCWDLLRSSQPTNWFIECKRPARCRRFTKPTTVLLRRFFCRRLINKAMLGSASLLPTYKLVIK